MRGPLVVTLSLWSVLTTAASAMADSASEPPLEAVRPTVDEPLYPPPSASWKVVALGLGTSAVAYGAAAGLSYAYPDAPGAHDLRIPFAGPWLAIAHNGCAGEPDCSQAMVVFRTVITAIDGLAQAGGVAVALEGLFMRTQQPRPASALPAASPPPSPPPSDGKEKNLFYLPMPVTIGMRGVGVGFAGRF
jgi:hypothetical protein